MLADWLEWRALRDGDRVASQGDLTAELRRGGTADATANADAPTADEDIGAEKTEAATDAAFSAIERRAEACGTGGSCYPFDVAGTSISARADADDSLYVFLLLLSRVGVTYNLPVGERTDVLFEGVALTAAAGYLGSPATDVQTFAIGFPRRGSASEFSAAIQQLCDLLGEGQGPRVERPGIDDQKDAKLDLVVWRRFADRRAGQLVGFGQCAAGEDWEEKLGELNPQAFIQTWMTDNLIVPPLRLFFVPHQVDLQRWYWTGSRAGVVFDRTRLVQHAQNLDASLRTALTTWSNYVLTTQVRA